MKVLPAELRPYLLDLTDTDKQVINGLFADKKKLSFAEWSQVILASYDEESIQLSDKLAHLISKVAYYAMRYEIPNELSNKYSSLGAKIWWVASLIQNGESEKAREILFEIDYESLSLLERAEWFNKLVLSYQRVGHYLDVTDAIEDINQFLNAIDDFDTKSCIRHTLLESHYAIGWSYLFLGEVKKSIWYAEEGMQLARQYGDNLALGYHTLLFGRISQFQGANEKAIQIYDECYNILTTCYDARAAMACKSNQGSIRVYQGKYLEAIKSLSISHKFWTNNKNNRNIILTTIMLSQAYLGVGNISRAKNHADNAFKLFRASEHAESGALVNIGFIYLSCDDLEKAEILVKQAEISADEKISKNDLTLIQALKGSIELKKLNLSKAEKHLDNALKAAVEMNYSDIIIKTMIHLSEISIMKFNFTGNVDDLVKAEQRTSDLADLIRTLKLPQELCRILLIKANIAKNQFEYEHACTLIGEQLQVATKHEFQDLIKKGKRFRDELQEGNIKELTSISKAKIKIDSSDDFSEMVLSLGSRRFTEEKSKVYALIIIHPEGTPLYTIDFSEDLETEVQNSLLLSGFLRAVTDLSADLFKGSKKAFLRAIEYINSTIIIEIEQNVIFSLLVEKETLELRFMLRQLIKDVSSQPDFMIYRPKIDQQFKEIIHTKVKKNFENILEA